jgi:hypothetical protein
MLSQDELDLLSRIFGDWNKLVVFERNRREWEELAEEEQGIVWEFETLSDTDQDN